MIDIENNWLAKTIGQKNDHDLANLYTDIVGFRKTGLLPPHSTLRELTNELEKKMSIPSTTFMRQVEDAILYEMARRYYNLLQEKQMS